MKKRHGKLFRRSEIAFSCSDRHRGLFCENFDIAKFSVASRIRGFIRNAVLAAQFAGNGVKDSLEVGGSPDEENRAPGVS